MRTVPRGFIALPAALLVVGVTVAAVFAQPDPLPADSSVLALVNQVNIDSLQATVDRLVAFHTRHTYSDTLSDSTGIGAARRWVRDRFEAEGLEAVLDPWTGYWNGSPWPCYNVKAELQGSETNPRLVVLGAHLDSRAANGADNTSFAPGADDDGSGVAALIEIARILGPQTFGVNLVPVAFTGEEQGLLGSSSLAQRMQEAGRDISAMLNMDMLAHIVAPDGQIDSTTIRCYSAGPMESSSRQLARYMKWVGEAYADGLTVNVIAAEDRPGRGGDHSSFSSRGFPAIRMIETGEDVAYQHGPNDVPENMSFSYMRKAVRMVLGTAAVIASAPPPPASPEVVNAGDGSSLLVTWPDSLREPGTVVRIAYRLSSHLSWIGIRETTDPPPYILDSLTTWSHYSVSVSFSGGNGLPSPFSMETEGIPTTTVYPPDSLEGTSTPQGVQLNWVPRPEPNITAYRVLRADGSGEFQQVEELPQPAAEWLDTSVEEGTIYRYEVVSVSDQDVQSDPGNVVEGALASHHLGLLMIDATADGNGSLGAPTDAEVDDFYATLLDGYDVAGVYDRADSVDAGAVLTDADLAAYRIVWVVNDGISGTCAEDTLAWRKFMENGGRLLVSGWRLSQMVENAVGNAFQFGPGDFLYDVAGIDSIAVTPVSTPEFAGITGDAEFPDAVVDSARFPQLGGRLPVVDAVRTETFPGRTVVIGRFDAASGDTSPFNGSPAAMLDAFEGPSWALVDAPGYMLTPESARAYFGEILDAFGAASTSVDEAPVAGFPADDSLLPAAPNPFNPETVIRFRVPGDQTVTLDVYNLLGRRVAALLNRRVTAGEHRVTWNADGLASGVYLVRLQGPRSVRTQKVLLLR